VLLTASLVLSGPARTQGGGREAYIQGEGIPGWVGEHTREGHTHQGDLFGIKQGE